MPLGTEVGLGPGDIVLGGTQLPPQKGAQQPPLFGKLLWPNGSLDQDATWYERRPSPGPTSPSEKGHSPHFSAHVHCGQTVAHLSHC